MKKSNTGLLIAILSVGVLILVALTLNLAMGGMWIVRGMDGKSAYELAVENGFQGSVTEWLATLGGSGGKSAYEIAVENGFAGSEKEWLISLAFGEVGKDGKDGKDGQNGTNGKNGRDGEDGRDGRDGISIRSVKINENGRLMVTLSDGSVLDAGAVGTVAVTEPDDFTKAQADGYSGTRDEWLRGLQTGSRTDSAGNKLSVADCGVNQAGHLIVTLSDGETKLDAGEIPADGYTSESVEAYNMRPRFETVVLNWENPALTIRDVPGTGASLNGGGYKAGTKFLCIGKGEVTEGDEFVKLLLPDGKIGYARSKFFEVCHLTRVGEEGMRLPASLTLTVGKSMRVTMSELAPWADELCFPVFDGDGLTQVDHKDGTYSLFYAAAGTYTLNVSLCRLLAADTVQYLDIKQVTVTVTDAKTVTGKKGLLIGDSRICPGTAGMASLSAELKRLLPGVEWVGTRKTPDGIPCEGYGGWKAENLGVSESVDGIVNAFRNPETKKFDFAYYLTEHPDCKPDFVVLNFGANDIYSLKSIEYLNAMVQSIHAYDPKLPVLVLTEYTMRPNETAFASDVERRLSATYFFRLTNAFAGKESGKTYLIPNFLSVDPTGDRADFIHLIADGYAREADVIVTYLADLLGT